MRACDVAVIGAGPYGLSVAAWLDGGPGPRLDTCVIGEPMQAWAEAKPAAMFLKSDGFASNLAAPGPGSTLGDYARAAGLAYHPTATRTSRETFVAYGRRFAHDHVAAIEPTTVTALARDGAGFALRTAAGTMLHARAVVLAVGIGHFAAIPPVLADLPAEHASHSYGHHRFDRFAGAHVTVIGGGASAVEAAAFLAEAGARVALLVRGAKLSFNSGPMGAPRSLWQRLRSPASGLGPGMKSWLCCNAPDLYRALPARRRLAFLHSHLGPRTPFEYRATVDRAVDVRTATEVERADVIDGRVVLACRGSNGARATIVTDHVIAGTGYRPDCRRLPFLDTDLAAAIEAEQGYPRLDAGFRTSVDGLYVVGPAAAGTFGPLLRFVYGAEFAAPRVAAAIRRSLGEAAMRRAA